MTYFSDNEPGKPEPSAHPLVYATLGLIFGIVSIGTFDKLLPQLIALGLSVLGLQVAKRRKTLGEKQTGKVMAITGLVLGSVYLLMWVAYFFLGRL